MPETTETEVDEAATEREPVLIETRVQSGRKVAVVCVADREFWIHSVLDGWEIYEGDETSKLGVPPFSIEDALQDMGRAAAKLVKAIARAPETS